MFSDADSSSLWHKYCSESTRSIAEATSHLKRGVEMGIDKRLRRNDGLSLTDDVV